MYTMTMNRPADWWGCPYREGIPLGNGKTGALVYGGAAFERILLTHAACWRGGVSPALPDVSACLPAMREKILNGHMPEGDRALEEALRASGYAPRCATPVPMVDLKITTPMRKGFAHYRRTLDMERACAEVRYEDGECAYRRRCFVSRADDLFALEITASGPLEDIQFEFAIHPPEGSNLSPRMPELLKNQADGEYLFYAAQLDERPFGAAARIIRGEKRVLVLAKVFPEGEAAAELERLRGDLAGTTADFDALLARHVPAHQALFGRCRFQLEDNRFDEAALNSALLDEAYETGMCSNRLTERMWAYGRYLLVSATEEEGLPCALAGLWCGEYEAGWTFNMANINLEMIYWQAVGGNLPELMKPVFDYYDAMLPAMRDCAKKLYGCEGIWLCAVTAPGSSGAAYAGRHILNWTGGAAWVSRIYYDYWLMTRDEDFLRRRLWPFLLETAAFYRDFVQWQGEKWYVVPSVSPENQPSAYRGEGKLNGSQGCVNATMDIALIRELFSTIQNLLPVMGENTGLRSLCEKMLSGSPDYEVNESGAVREWNHPDFIDNDHHRHQSHVYPLFPGWERARGDRAMFRQAVLNRLSVGLSDQTSWGLMNMACSFARLEDGEGALNCLSLTARAMLMGNLFTVHNDWRDMGIGMLFPWAPFQIDANMGWTAAVQEMLACSCEDRLALFPALPAAWETGSFEGLGTRCGVVVDLSWHDAEKTARITALRDTAFICEFAGEMTGRLVLNKGESVFKSTIGKTTGQSEIQIP